MTPLLAATDWRMTFAFAAAMGLLILVLKVLSALQDRPPIEARPRFWATFLPSVRSLARVEAAGPSEKRRALVRCGLSVTGSILVYLACTGLVRVSGASGIWLGWIGAPLLWLMGEVVGSLIQVLMLPSGRLLPLAHENIFAARSVADFWGRRWNVWMSDWFRQVIYQPLRRRPLLAMVIVFVISGFLHELVINLSLWLLTGRNLFGSMMAYFGLQAAGVFIERSCLTGHPGLQWIFCWLVVAGPAPLIVNEGVLRALQLWP